MGHRGETSPSPSSMFSRTHADALQEEAVMRKRVRAMGRIAIMMKKMRMEAENNIKQLETQGRIKRLCFFFFFF